METNPASGTSGMADAGAEPAFRPAEGGQPLPPSPGAASIAGTSRDDRPLWKRILPALVLAAIGVAFLFGVKALYEFGGDEETVHVISSLPA